MSNIGLTLNANEEVPMLSPCPPPSPPPAAMLSKFFDGKFKYLNRKNSEFLAGNSNAKCKMQNRPNPNSEFFAVKFKCKIKFFFRPNTKFSPEHKIFAPT